MLWTELELECDPPDERLRAAWAAVFQVGADRVAVVDDVAAADPWSGRTRIVLERRRQPGDFPVHVMAVLGNERLDARVATASRSLEAVQAICAALGCRALISDDDPNPYRWILVGPEGDIATVRVDPRQLDERGAFVLAPLPSAAETAA